MTTSAIWFEDYLDDSDDTQVAEYDIAAAPNDFNVLTINNFLESGAVRIPTFQRNYVWDIIRASKLIESLILGLPVPQVFLYEQDRNKFIVIDGQQRLLSIYYFIKQRFPRKDRRAELRAIFDNEGKIPENILHSDDYFENFRLKFSTKDGASSRFKGLSYSTLDSYQTQFQLRTIRNVILKQNAPTDDDSSIYEIFNRLNTGGVNLRPQEIRMSMYSSKFYDMLYTLNSEAGWRRLLGGVAPDLHMKDIEILLRGFALLTSKYAPSMVRFLNTFSKKAARFTPSDVDYLATLFRSFVTACQGLDAGSFLNKKNGRFNIALFEATFVAVCEEPLKGRTTVQIPVNLAHLQALEADGEFVAAATEGTTHTINVEKRLLRARTLLLDGRSE
jgi:hypothetical protein